MGAQNRNITASVRLRMSYVTEPIFVDKVFSEKRPSETCLGPSGAYGTCMDPCWCWLVAQVRADARADAKFQNMTPNEQKIAELEKKKAAAVTLEDFALAQKLTEEISAMKKEIEHLNITV